MTISKHPKVETMLADDSVPFEIKKQLLVQLCASDDEGSNQALAKLFTKLKKRVDPKDQYLAKRAELVQLMKAMLEGPKRVATFLRMLDDALFGRCAVVALDDGQTAAPMVPDEELAKNLRTGDTVWLEADAKAVLYRDSREVRTGELATLDEVAGEEAVVTLRDHERQAFTISACLQDQIDRGEVEPGCEILVSSKIEMAYAARPVDRFARFEYLVKEDVPAVVVERDIGAPPAYLSAFAEHVEREMLEPEVARKYNLRRSRTQLLSGVPGTGKSLSIQGLWNLLYRTMSTVTGASVEDLPHRVLRFKASQILSKWLGESDKHIDRFFDEVEELASMPWEGPDGRSWDLPILVICEEIDGIARSRGSGSDSIHDRILTTLLQRLDVTTQKLGERLVLFVFTTNTAEVVDAAFLRRASEDAEIFDRMEREAFVAVLEKQVARLPFRETDEVDQAKMREQAIADLTTWLFRPNDEEPQVEIIFNGQTAAESKLRRDFLTGGLVDRAVQQAASEACRLERIGVERPGLTTALLMQAVDKQVANIVAQLVPENVRDYITLPPERRVNNVRRVRRTGPSLFELERAS